MSFQNKSLWMLRDGDVLTEGEINGDTSSGIEQKHAHRLFTDAFEGELFSNKKHVLQSVNGRPISAPTNSNFSLWNEKSSFQCASNQFCDRLRGPGPLETYVFSNKNGSSSSNENLSIERNCFIDLLQNDSTVSLSMYHAGDNPTYLNAGAKEARINHANGLTDDLPFSLGNSSNTGEESIISAKASYLGLPYNAGNENVISMCPNPVKAEQSFIPVGQTFNKVNGDFMLMGHQYSMGESVVSSEDQVLGKGNNYCIPLNQPYKENSSFMSICPPYGKAHENFISMIPSYKKYNENCMSMGLTCDNEDNNVASMGPTSDRVEAAVVSAVNNSQDYSSFLSISKGEGATISFGGFQHEPVGSNPFEKLISSHDLLITGSSAEASESLTEQSTVEHSADQIGIIATTSTTESVPKKKVKKTKKSAPNNFPSNVKSLLSTGIFDGVPVKYVSWSREKSVRGIIKGTGYLCGCNDCKLSKNLNAYEFESHAACKTKHPNNHVYFENGKTIYAVVQELKNVPQEMLFEAIQNITGSPINQKNFQIWKESYQAATRELHRIYGNHDLPIPS